MVKTIIIYEFPISRLQLILLELLKTISSTLCMTHFWFLPSCRCSQRKHSSLTCPALGRWPLQRTTPIWAPTQMRTMSLCWGASQTQTASSLTTRCSQTTHCRGRTAAASRHYIEHAPATNPLLWEEFWREGSQKRMPQSWTSMAGWESHSLVCTFRICKCSSHCLEHKHCHLSLSLSIPNRMAWCWLAAKVSLILCMDSTPVPI